MIAIQLLVAIIFGTHALRSARAFHHQQTVQELSRLTVLLRDSYAELVKAGDIQTLDRLIKQHGREGGIRITVIDQEDGRPLADSHGDVATMDNHLGRPEVRMAINGQTGTANRFSDSVLIEMMYYAEFVPARSDGGRNIILRTAVPMTEVNADLRRLLGTLGIAGLAVLLITVAGVYIVSRLFSDTISTLSHRATALAAGDAHHPIEEPSARELVPLVQAVNDMAGQLHDRIVQLQANQHEHEAILQSMNSGVIALDLDQRVVRLNRSASEMLGSHVEGLTKGRLLQEVVRNDGLNRFVQSAMHEHARQPAEFRLRSDPETIVQAMSSPLTDAEGRRVGILIVLNDVTAIRRLESLRSDFAANVSHELRTPITNIKGYVETMLEVGVDDAEQAQRFLDIIKRNSDRLAAIVEDILSLAWLEQPGTRQSLEREPTLLAPVIKSVVTQFENAAHAKRITLNTNVPDDLQVLMNRQLIEQAIANYASNAIKYSPPDTTITITAIRRSDQDEIEIAVADQGPGIPREHLPRIFERFYRVDKARSRELGGTGLGLAIVKHIALVHGGRVDVHSTVGQGSIFRLILT